LAYITGTVNQALLLRNECLVAENCILKAQIKTRLQLSDAERATPKRSSAGPQGSRESSCGGQTRYDSGVISEIDRQQVRWIEGDATAGLI
jgi:hypothetical protein